MIKSRFSPREIVHRLQMIEALTAEGLPVVEAIRSAGVQQPNTTSGRSNTMVCGAPSVRCSTRRQRL